MKIKKKWIIVIASAIILVLGIGAFIYFKNQPYVFTKPEYIKEVVVQNENFNDLLDEFLDQVSSYNGTVDSTKKLEETSNRFTLFVSGMETKLKPRVPAEAKDHYNKMMDAYKIYLDAIALYKRAVPKNPSTERNDLLNQAKSKLEEAQIAMKELK